MAQKNYKNVSPENSNNHELMLNLGCGNRFHLQWKNIDFSPVNKFVKKANLLEKLPFQDNTISYIYCSHFLEHIPRNKVLSFLGECARILKQDGILRLVVPDLENICKEYIRIIDNEPYSFKRDWIVHELLDQMVRMEAGGGMQKIYNRLSVSDDKDYKQYVYERVGEKFDNNMVSNKKREITWDKILKAYLLIIRKLIPKKIRNIVFVQTSSGEKHLWMYDKYQLTDFSNKVGFSEINFKKYNISEIPNFNSYLLDINEDDSPYKGVSSLYCECKK